jgi:hypothetical protein
MSIYGLFFRKNDLYFPKYDLFFMNYELFRQKIYLKSPKFSPKFYDFSLKMAFYDLWLMENCAGVLLGVPSIDNIAVEYGESYEGDDGC